MANAGNGQNSGFPSSLAAAIALLVAALAAIGLTGAALLRAVRNDPHEISTALTWALIGGGIIAGAQFLPSSDSASTDATKSVTTFTKITAEGGAPGQTIEERTTTETTSLGPPSAKGRTVLGWLRRVFTIVGLVVLVFSVSHAIASGAGAVSDREGPLVTLQAASVNPPAAPTAGSLEVTVSIRAVGMTTTNYVPLQVLGLRTISPWIDQSTVAACEVNHAWNEYKNYIPLTSEDQSTLLSWARLGPDVTGAVNTSWKIQVPAGQYGGLCAWATFQGTLEEGKPTVHGEVDTSAAYLRISR